MIATKIATKARVAPCFIFHTKMDSEIYRYLMTDHREAMEKIKADSIRYIESERADGNLKTTALADAMEWELREFFADQCPIDLCPERSDFTFGIFSDLLGNAVVNCDFVHIAEAFLAGVELPPYEITWKESA